MDLPRTTLRPRRLAPVQTGRVSASSVPRYRSSLWMDAFYLPNGSSSLRYNDIVLTYRSTPNSVLPDEKSPAKVMFGRKIHTCLELLRLSPVRMSVPANDDRKTPRSFSFKVETVGIPCGLKIAECCILIPTHFQHNEDINSQLDQTSIQFLDI